jgi:hypothetical protein
VSAPTRYDYPAEAVGYCSECARHEPDGWDGELAMSRMFTFAYVSPLVESLGPYIAFAVKKHRGTDATLQVGVHLKPECMASTSCEIAPAETEQLASMFGAFAHALDAGDEYAATWSAPSGRFTLVVGVADARARFEATLYEPNAGTRAWNEQVGVGESVEIVPNHEVANEARQFAAALREPPRRRLFA